MKRTVLLACIAALFCMVNIQCGPGGESVYICNGDEAMMYHNDIDCPGLYGCTQEIEKIPSSKAIEKGYGECNICY